MSASEKGVSARLGLTTLKAESFSPFQIGASRTWHVADQLQTIALSYFGNGMPSPLMLCVLGCGITARHCEQVRHASRHARR
eukprot:scaffold653_cov68-Phaeocystis_antarctica.AAC.3